jgi:hypothetical protein
VKPLDTKRSSKTFRLPLPNRHALAAFATVSVAAAEREQTATVVGELLEAAGTFAEGLAVRAVGESATVKPC